jgi:NAD(P)-dependent dehydrogenase (short-subunit alcohol dehydrogenase family)
MKRKWTSEDIPDQSGKVAIVTGANSGLGFASAKALAEKGATVVLACRSEERGQEALRQMAASASTEPVFLQLDLSDLASVKQFSEQFLSQFDRLDILMNNAGIMATPYRTTTDGFEQQIGVNHLGHFALTGRLMECLLGTPESRIVNVSSLAARNSQVKPDSFREPEAYQPWAAYGQSKLANLMFTLELRDQLKDQDTIAIAAHPGGAATNLGRNVQSGKIVKWLAENILLPLLPSPEQNAAPQLLAATAAEVQNGAYYGPGGWGEINGAPKQVDFPESIGKKADWQRLWQASEALTGVEYSI